MNMYIVQSVCNRPLSKTYPAFWHHFRSRGRYVALCCAMSSSSSSGSNEGSSSSTSSSEEYPGGVREFVWVCMCLGLGWVCVCVYRFGLGLCVCLGLGWVCVCV